MATRRVAAGSWVMSMCMWPSTMRRGSRMSRSLPRSAVTPAPNSSTARAPADHDPSCAGWDGGRYRWLPGISVLRQLGGRIAEDRIRTGDAIGRGVIRVEPIGAIPDLFRPGEHAGLVLIRTEHPVREQLGVHDSDPAGH
jgi:hypothetical protein